MRDPKKMTEKERTEEICAILANGIMRARSQPKDDIKQSELDRSKKESL